MYSVFNNSYNAYERVVSNTVSILNMQNDPSYMFDKK